MAVPKPILSDFDILPPARKLMEALSKGEEQYQGEAKSKEARRYRAIATDLIKKYNADDLFKPDSENLGRNVLHYAISTNDTENALALINKTGVTAKQLFQQDKFGFTPLHKAIEKGNGKVASALINKPGVTADQLFKQDEYGFTPLHRAIEKNSQGLAMLLIGKAGTNKNLQKTTKDPKKDALQIAKERHMHNQKTPWIHITKGYFQNRPKAHRHDAIHNHHTAKKKDFYMLGLLDAIKEHGSQVKNPDIAAEIAMIESNKLLDSIKYGNVTLIKELVTKDPAHPNKYIVPVKKVHLIAARAVEGVDLPFSTPYSILKLLESEYRKNKVADSKQSKEPVFTETKSPQKY